MDSFFTELRRRNVLRLAATYALVAWILIEAGSVLLPTFGVPDWFFRAYVIVIFAGFLVSLVLAWIFEITPEGVKLEREIDRETQPRQDRSKSNVVIIALLVIALGVSITFNVTGIRSEHESAIASGAAMNSIAVLPFTSRSTDPENQFFADGMHDDLLTRLADIESLRVISRTSVNEYRNTNKNLREIGTELGVATIVEGAVQRIGDQVRITVQLIDAATDEHLWAESYDRELTASNVFHIQSDISAQIASALRAALSPEEEVRLAVVPTQSLEALSLFTAARNNLYLRRFDTLLEARGQFERAIEIDPNYAQAHAGLAETVLVIFNNHNAIPVEEAQQIAGDAVARALEIDDQLAEAHAAQGLLEYNRYKTERTGNASQLAAAAYERAIALNPNLANAYVWYATLRESEGDIEGAIDLLTTAMEIDPLGRIPYLNLPNFYARLGKNDKAVQLLLKSAAIFPDWPSPYESMAQQLIGLGRLDEALAWSRAASAMTDDPMAGKDSVRVYIEFGEAERMADFTSRFAPDHPMYPLGDGFMRFMNNDFQGTVDALAHYEELPETQGQVAYSLIAISAAILEDYDMAREYLLRANPMLASDTSLNVNRHNYQSAILLAYVNRGLGRDREASELLSQAWNVIQDLPRIGIAGYGISDVHVLAIQGRKNAALDALRDAIDEGFVSLVSFEMWTLDQDILIDNLRDDPRFEAMRDELHGLIEAMRDNVRRAEETGDWSELQNRVRGQLTAAVRL
jgi:TolB-like protein/Tfp pilus assembly protein PilF